jgi:hypothetical protein
MQSPVILKYFPSVHFDGILNNNYSGKNAYRYFLGIYLRLNPSDNIYSATSRRR